MGIIRDIKMTADGDWDVSGGTLNMVSDGDAIVQAVTLKLQFFIGEWFLDLSWGTYVMEDVFTKNPDPAALQAMFINSILSVPGINQVLALSLTLDNETRVLSVTWRADSDVGELSSTTSATVT